jgi:outer membrane receptor protein involved in Fe transport
MVDHIEIIRGPGSVIYGSTAFVAVVNIILKNDSNVPYSQDLSTAWGNDYQFEDNYLHMQSSVNFKINDALLSAGVNLLKNQGNSYSSQDFDSDSGSGRDFEDGITSTINLRSKIVNGTVFYSIFQEPLNSMGKWPDNKLTTHRIFANLGRDFSLPADMLLSVNADLNLDDQNVNISILNQLKPFANNAKTIPAHTGGTDIFGELTLQGKILEDGNFLLGTTIEHLSGEATAGIDGSSTSIIDAQNSRETFPMQEIANAYVSKESQMIVEIPPTGAVELNIVST